MEPFKISISEQQLHDLSIRLKQVRWPSSFSVEPWALGTDRSFLKRLVDYWSTEYNWREQEAWLNRFPQFMEHVDGFDIHFVHVRGEGTSARPLLLTHGWPGSFVEMLELIPYLTTPSLYGGHAEEAFDVIIPSLPGFAFSSKPTRPGVGAKYVATLWAKLMDRLDYERYLVQGGDIGAGVSTWLAFMYPERVMGLHLNYIPGSYKPPLTPNTPSVSEEEQAYLDIVAEWLDREGAYSALHRTKLETLAFALSDSPTGLASWMVEKFQGWSDCDGDIEKSFSLDHILTNISIYWFTNSIASSMRIYTEGSKMPLHFTEGQRVTVPTGVSLFPKELPTPPRSWVERVYNITYWEKANKGGHFAAMENPKLFAEHLNHFFHSLSI
ncbi:multidrug MFS transporter [Paenibacillus peoriae]|uniref:epoxide hydrolase family protein n=1 Tax=Paenibacillus peoriae TaxID=59893 RepID=UPI0006A6D673|nr:epoxide hydrolase family protein [Paenibacillus peoriae]ALA42403.1 multidrug MFS transporter [Paenibacillus peoriae]